MQIQLRTNKRKLKVAGNFPILNSAKVFCNREGKKIDEPRVILIDVITWERGSNKEKKAQALKTAEVKRNMKMPTLNDCINIGRA